MSRYIDLDKIEFLKVDGNKEFNRGVDCCINRLLKAEQIEPVKDIKEYYKEIWDCEVDHPKYEDKVKDIVETTYTTGYLQGVEITEKEYKIEIKNSISLEKVKLLGEELRNIREGIIDDNVLYGFNMAIAICNKYLGESEVQDADSN